MSTTIPGEFPMALRAWPSKDDHAIPLSSLISRINAERGSFRNVTEESLLQELREEEAGVAPQEIESGIEVGDSEDAEPNRLKELARAREEVLVQLSDAHNAAMVTLDFISLLLSKDTPIQASLSISPTLRDAVALGTLGADKVQDSKVTKAQKQDNRRIAKGWKLQGLNEAVDSVLASATRLEKEIEKETKYWEQVLAVSDRGWAICRLPQERHTLGVRFGFSESAPTFNNHSLGALRRNMDGTIYLDQGIIDSTPKRVRIRVQTDGITSGESSSTEIVSNPTSIWSSILIARNTIFEEELWQELNREARILANQGVRHVGNEIVYIMTTKKRLVLDLQVIDVEEIPQQSAENSDDDTVAEGISLTLRLLLSYAHRHDLRHRSQPPLPISGRPPPNFPYNLLRPILARLRHESIKTTLTDLLAPLSKALISAAAINSPYTHDVAPVASTNLIKSQNLKIAQSVPEGVIDSLISNLSAELTIQLTQSTLLFETQSLSINLHTAPSSLITRFQIVATGKFASSCKPPPNPSSVEEVKVYILWATACALAGTFARLEEQAENTDLAMSGGDGKDSGIGSGNDEPNREAPGVYGWYLTHNPTTLRKSFWDEKDSKDLYFKIAPNSRNPESIEVRVTYKYIIGGAGSESEASEKDDGAVKYVWESDNPSGDIDGDDNENKKSVMTLKQFVEDVGGWKKSLNGEMVNSLGDGYEGEELGWS